MKGLYFMITGDKPDPNHIQVFDDWNSLKFFITMAIDEKLKATVSFQLDKIVTASTTFVEFSLDSKDLYITMDGLMPASANNIIFDLKKDVMISFELDRVPLGFLTRPIRYDKKKDKIFFAFPEKLVRLQRRMFYRFELAHNDEVYLLHDFPNIKQKQLPVRNISEGGLCILCPKSFESFFEDEIKVLEDKKDQEAFDFEEAAEMKILPATLKMFNKKEMPIEVTLKYGVRSGHRIFRYNIGVLFTKISGGNRNAIGNFVFQKQKEEIKKIHRMI